MAKRFSRVSTAQAAASASGAYDYAPAPLGQPRPEGHSKAGMIFTGEHLLNMVKGSIFRRKKPLAFTAGGNQYVVEGLGANKGFKVSNGAKRVWTGNWAELQSLIQNLEAEVAAPPAPPKKAAPKKQAAAKQAAAKQAKAAGEKLDTTALSAILNTLLSPEAAQAALAAIGVEPEEEEEDALPMADTEAIYVREELENLIRATEQEVYAAQKRLEVYEERYAQVLGQYTWPGEGAPAATAATTPAKAAPAAASAEIETGPTVWHRIVVDGVDYESWAEAERSLGYSFKNAGRIPQYLKNRGHSLKGCVVDGSSVSARYVRKYRE